MNYVANLTLSNLFIIEKVVIAPVQEFAILLLYFG